MVHRSMKFAQLILLSAIIPLSGCLDSGNSGTNDASVGLVTPSGISGLSYTTASQQGTTTADGSYRYYPGEQLRLMAGDLVIADGIPARDVITPLEFIETVRSRLGTPGIDDEGLLTHRITEQDLLNNVPLMNMTRFLLSLNWEDNTRDGRGIELRQRVIDQLNARLPYLSSPVDFMAGETTFTAEGDTPSPANQLLAGICFYPEDHRLCGEPPSQEEIDLAPIKPAEDALRDPDILYQDDLQNLRDQILAARRTVGEVSQQDAREYLARELDLATTGLANRYYLDVHTASHPATDTAIKTFNIRAIGGAPELEGLEAISTRPLDVQVHAWDRQSATVDYFVAGAPGAESEILVNFRPAGSYRWVRKSLRVLVR